MKTPGQILFETAYPEADWSAACFSTKERWEQAAVDFYQSEASKPRTELTANEIWRTSADVAAIQDGNYQICREENGRLRCALHQICTTFFADHDGGDGACATKMLMIAENALARLVPEEA